MKKFASLVLAVCMVMSLCIISFAESADVYELTCEGIKTSYVSDDWYFEFHALKAVDYKIPDEAEVVAKFYSDETLLTTLTLNDIGHGTIDNVIGSRYFPIALAIRKNIFIPGAWDMEPNWIPYADLMLNYATLYIEGIGTLEWNLTDEYTENEWLALKDVQPGSPFEETDETVVDLDFYEMAKHPSKDNWFLRFEITRVPDGVIESMVAELYSGETKITTATLTPSAVIDVNDDSTFFIPFYTSVAPGMESDSWTYTDWTPYADIVPDKIVVTTNGNEVLTCEGFDLPLWNEEFPGIQSGAPEVEEDEEDEEGDEREAREPSEPSPQKIERDRIVAAILAAKEGDTVTLDVKKLDVVSRFIADAMSGKNVNLEYALGEDTVTVNGKNVPKSPAYRVWYSLELFSKFA